MGLRILKALVGEGGATWTVIHPDDRQDPRSRLGEFEAFADRHGLPFLCAASAREAHEALAVLAPDIVFVCGWYWLFGAGTLALARDGFFGIHNSLLPAYRGGAPLVWSIMNGEQTVGSTVFRMGPGMDDGDILLQVAVRNGPDRDVGDILAEIEERLAVELPDRWRALLAGEARLQPQDEAAASYCGQRTPEDGRIEWREPAARVHDFVRAQAPPYPGAFTLLGDRRVTVLKSEVDARRWYGAPGQVLAREDHAVAVACAHGTALRLLRVAVDGKEEAPRDVFRSVRDRL
ncbi:MAG TPA: methionyl-tRNA formyltransferase [Azospirillaceae bacterium]|nr:methionyl-tRNA formyltransferase [Azospirillaceae bacterium]